VTASSGDVWAETVNPNATYTPITLTAGQTGASRSHVVERPELAAMLGTGVLVRIGNQAEVADYPPAVQLEQVVGPDIPVRHPFSCQGRQRGRDLADRANYDGGVGVAAQGLADGSRDRHHVPGCLARGVRYVAVEQGQDARDVRVSRQEGDLVAEPA